MQFVSKLVFSVVGGLWLAFSLGCSDPDGTTAGVGGSTSVETGVSSGAGAGGATEAGGTTQTNNTATQVGGSSGSANGGASSSTVTSVETGGRTGAGGATPSSGDSGTSASGGASNSSSTSGATGGRTTIGGNTGSGGRTGTGGTTATTGTTGGANTGGATATRTSSSTAPPGTIKKWFGNIDTRGSIRSDFATMWDQFSPENAGKWGSVQGSSQNSFNWSSLDRMYKYCEDNKIIFKEHCFIWGSQQPNWVNNSNAETAVKAWMKAFCDRYPNTKIIDVVNEPLHPKPAYRDGIGGNGASGWDWIVNALKWAREACPNAILVVNDYNTIEYSSENTNIISLVNAVKKAGGPIDAVGCQAHDIAKVTQATMTNFGQKIIDQTGLPLHITEMDIGIADDNQQATRMKEFVTWAWTHPQITGITYWGYIVGATWRANTGLMTESGTKRPALTWLLSYLGR